MADAPVRVLGLGNVLMGDDAFGPYVVKMLEALYATSSDVNIIDVGTPGLDLMPFLMGASAVVFIDTVKSAGLPGELRLYRRDEILRHAPQPRLSPHDPGVKEALLTLDFTDSGPRDVFLIGVVPERVSPGVGLSESVRRAVPWAVSELVHELERLGVWVWRRLAPSPPNIWWEPTAVGLARIPVIPSCPAARLGSR